MNVGAPFNHTSFTNPKMDKPLGGGLSILLLSILHTPLSRSKPKDDKPLGRGLSTLTAGMSVPSLGGGSCMS